MPEIDETPGEDGHPTERSKQAAPAEALPADDMHHRVAGSSIVVVEESGVAAAEATGKISTDNEEDPQETAGSG